MTTASLKAGTARSGRAICTYATTNRSHIETLIQDCTEAEHFDAWAIFQRLAAREIRRRGQHSDQLMEYQMLTELHREHLTDLFIEDEKGRLGLATSPDLVRFARQLTEDIFRD